MRNGWPVLLLLWTLTSGAVTVSSKINNESNILGEMAVAMGESVGVRANHRAGLGATRIVWKALLRGDIDLYAEYTGTLIHELFPDKQINNLSDLRRELSALGLALQEPLGFNNTYAMGMKRDTAEKLGLRKISDLEKHPELKFGFSHEFMNRQEGWPALKRKYQLPQTDVRGMEHEVTYLGVASGAIDVTDLYSTDAEVAYHDLVALEDDRKLFPTYYAAFLYRKELERTHPAFLTALSVLSGQISDKDMTAMNAEVKLHKKKEREVARSFLMKRGFLAEQKASSFTQSSLWGYTVQHLKLVSISLWLTILVAVPLGVLASLKPSVGEVILTLTGIIQTIPALALLVFMIPFLGIGARPALVALFLYGLLPILRNTYTGLRDIPHNLLESADALGLPRWVRLIKIELPLASRAILAGIKTSAVINVGTATLGAIIGAGGFGEPILMGIRRDDVPMILEGAVPAALMAIVVQALFEMCERYLIPKGLRLKRAASH